MRLVVLSLFSLLLACTFENKSEVLNVNNTILVEIVDTSGSNLKERFQPPIGFQRKNIKESSYGYYLRNISLKPHKSKVLYYDGSIKANRNIYCAVLKQPISKRDLQQCADAVMRLRGEYLFAQNKFDEIHFNFLSDNKPRYFKDYGDKTNSYKNFLKYMDYVFAFANTRSLYNELKPIKSLEMEIGDVFIQTGKPYGHAVTVMDIAENKNGEKVFILSQSYMPAQETQILINPNNAEISPWYSLKDKGELVTPEWTFSFSDLRRFPNE